MPKISKNLVAYIADMLMRYTPTLNLVSDTEFTSFFKRKLVEWYAAAPKNDRRAPPREEAAEEAPGEAREGRGGQNRWPRRLVWISKPLQQCNPISRPKKADRRTVRAAPAFDSNQGASEPDRDRF